MIMLRIISKLITPAINGLKLHSQKMTDDKIWCFLYTPNCKDIYGVEATNVVKGQRSSLVSLKSVS